MDGTAAEDSQQPPLPMPAITWKIEPLPTAARRPSAAAVIAAALGVIGGVMLWQGAETRSADAAATSEEIVAGEAVLAGETLVTGSLPTIYHVDPATCTSLALDREANRTLRRPCPRDGIALRLDTGMEREDLAILAAGQSAP